MKLKQGLIIAGVVVIIGLLWLYLAMVGPLQNLNIGFGLASGLSQVKLPGGYSMANVVLFVIFVVILIVLGAYFFGKKGDKAA
jgi:membrane protein implicated in regulation of membrane protease activity